MSAVSLFSYDFEDADVSAVARRLIELGREPCQKTFLVVTANVDHLVHLQENTRFVAAYRFAGLRLVDGFPLAIYSRLRGRPIRRVPGSDLIVEVFKLFSPLYDRPFFVLPNAETGERIATMLCAVGFTNPDFGIYIPEFGFEKSDTLTTNMLTEIDRAKPTHLIMAVGAPKSEVWVHENSERIGAVVALCVGAGVEFLAGTKRRAPVWMRNSGLEWMWRVGGDPRRLLKRYAVGAAKILSFLLFR